MKLVYLVVIFYVNGQAIMGGTTPGTYNWGPRLQPSMAVCQERAKFANHGFLANGWQAMAYCIRGENREQK